VETLNGLFSNRIPDREPALISALALLTGTGPPPTQRRLEHTVPVVPAPAADAMGRHDI